MAKATKRTETREVVVGYTLELTPEEAKHVRLLVGREPGEDAGHPNHDIYIALLDADL
jgi:hypothetical protein